MKLPLFRRPVPNAPAPAPRPAAGILLTHTDRHGQPWVLLGQRSRRLGGTWCNIGGSLEPGEAALAGALREFHEELGIDVTALVGGTIVAVIDDCGTPLKPYTLFVIDVPKAFDDAVLGWENDDLAWFHPDDVATLNLHDKFAGAWATLRARCA